MTASGTRVAEEPSSEAGLPLRLAQRAFAALLERRTRVDAADGGEFAGAQLRSAARRTLSALSADEQSGLLRWLGLQIATRNASGVATAGSRLLRVDAALATGVMATVGRTREELVAAGHEETVAA